jgi:hypothetical protein
LFTTVWADTYNAQRSKGEPRLRIFFATITRLDRIQDNTGIATSLKFIVQGIPVLPRRFHCNSRFAFASCWHKDLAFEQVNSCSIILKRFQGCNNGTLRSHGSCRMFSFSDVDTDNVAVIDQNGVGFLFAKVKKIANTDVGRRYN